MVECEINEDFGWFGFSIFCIDLFIEVLVGVL